MEEVLRYSVSAPMEERDSVVLYRDGGIYRIRVERGTSVVKKGIGTPIRTAEVQTFLESLSSIQLPMMPEEHSEVYDDATVYELSGSGLNCQFSFEWAEEIPVAWKVLKPIIVWLETRKPK